MNLPFIDLIACILLRMAVSYLYDIYYSIINETYSNTSTRQHAKFYAPGMSAKFRHYCQVCIMTTRIDDVGFHV